MVIENGEAAVGGLVRIYPKEVVLGKLERAYWEELGRLVRELDDLLPDYQTPTEEASDQVQDGFLALVTSGQETLSLGELERRLECLLGQALEIAVSDEEAELAELVA